MGEVEEVFTCVSLNGSWGAGVYLLIVQREDCNWV